MKKVLFRRCSALFALLAGAASVLATEIPYDYHVPLTAENAVLGCFPASKKPVLTIPSGAVVKIEGGGGAGAVRDNADPTVYLKANHIPMDPGTMICLQETAQVLKDSKKYAGALMGHMLVGPIYIEGAEAGDSIEIRILDVSPRIDFGTTSSTPGRGGLALGMAAPPPAAPTPGSTTSMPRPGGKITILDVKRNVGIFSPGIEVPLKPFMGVMGVCPPDSAGENVNSRAPGPYGGNLDCSELTTGSTLYLPVFQPGALFYTGDSHAAQGDGEVTGTAIETADSCTLQFILHKGTHLAMPRAETATDYISFGLNADLNLAMKQAISESIDFLKETRQIDIVNAYALCSIAVNYRVTQVVDATLGIHAMIPKRLFVNETNTYWYRPKPF